MKTNIYFTIGGISILSASVAASISEASDKNILIIEKAHNLFDGEYFDINRILQTLFSWDKVIEIDCDHNVCGIKTPIKYIKICIYRYLKQKKIRNQLDNCGDTKIFATMPSQLWPSMTRSLDDLTVIEHGSSEYNLLHRCQKQKKNFLEHIYRIGVHKLLGDSAMNVYTVRKFFLLDGFRSKVTKNFLANENLDLTSYDASKIFQEYSKNFEIIFANKYPLEYKKITEFKETLARYKNKYIYIPSSWVSEAEMQQYLTAQLRYVDTEKSAFIIKSHPQYQYNYKYLNFSGSDVYQIDSKIQASIPIEFLLPMLGYPTILGSYSMALLYAEWWFNVKSTLTLVEGHEMTKELVRQYGAVVGDFCKTKE